MSGRKIERQWRSYRAEVLPIGASPAQVIECRRAFYAGAQALRAEFLKTPDHPAGQEAAVLEIEAELDAFGRDVRAGVA